MLQARQVPQDHVVLLELQALQVIWVQQVQLALQDRWDHRDHLVPQDHKGQAVYPEHQEDMFLLCQLTVKVRQETNQVMLL